MGQNRRPGRGPAVGATVAGQFVDAKARSKLGVAYIHNKGNDDKIAVVQAVDDEMLAARTPTLLIRELMVMCGWDRSK